MKIFDLNYIIKKQLGGSDNILVLKKEIDNITKNASKLNLYKNLLEQKINTMEKLNIEPISKMLSKIETDLKQLKSKISVNFDTDKDLILNQLDTIDNFILNNEDSAITINLERTPKLITTPIDSEKLTLGLDRSIDVLVKETDSFRDLLRTRIDTTEQSFLEKKNNLDLNLEDLEKKNKNLIENINIIETEYKKIEDYKKLDNLEILPTYFKFADAKDIDFIEIDKLPISAPVINLQDPSTIQDLKVEDIYQEEINKKILDATQIIKPNIIKLNQTGGNINTNINNINQQFIILYQKIKEKIFLKLQQIEREIKIRDEQIMEELAKDREIKIQQEKQREENRKREEKDKTLNEIESITKKLRLIEPYKNKRISVDILRDEVNNLSREKRKIESELNNFERNLRTTKDIRVIENLKKSILERQNKVKKINSSIEEKNNIIQNLKEVKNILDEEESLKIRLEMLRKSLEMKYILKGGNWDIYNNTITKMYQLINDIRGNIKLFKKIAMKFNLRYIQFYYHQYFVINYLNLIFFRENYIISRFLSRGLVSFYLTICEEISNKMNLNDKSKIINYFFKYHYITINLLKSFLQNLYISWDTVLKPSLRDEERKNINNYKFMMKNLNPDIKYNNSLQKGILLFDIFKNILDNYYTFQAPPVAVYLRINDWDKITNPTFYKLDKERTMFDSSKFNNCIIPPSGENNLDLDKYKKNIANIKFKEIYDPEGFNDNAILSNYMGNPSFLTDNRSIMMITYGYSGVGKTFTLFGGNGKSGVLQNSIIGIQGTQKILCRCFEIYGKALPYKSYWLNKTPDEYNHNLISYNLLDFDNIVIDENINKNFNNYLDKTKGLNETSYFNLTTEQVNNFEKVVSGIDKIRIENGRIKKTVNNPVSSRSIMMYEFKLILRGNKISRFIVMDLPGKEDVISSYINNDSVGYCVKVKREFEIYGRALRASLFVNPMTIALFPSISQYILKTYSSYLNKKTLSKIPPELIEKTLREFTIQYTGDTNIKTQMENTIKAVEIVKFLIDENKINELEKIYNYILENEENIQVDKTIKTCQEYNSSSLPFEAFYINENITGLIKVLAERLYQGDDKKEKREELLSKFKYMDNFYSNNMEDKDTFNSIKKGSRTINTGNFTLFREIEDETVRNNVDRELPDFSKQIETRSQVYFLRNLIRSPIRYQDNDYNLYSIRDDKIILNITNDTLYKNAKYISNNNSKTIQQWFENSYDFNKIYSEEPPIKTFLQAYFGDEDVVQGQPTKKIIDNFYLFFVVSNMNQEKCGNQIKLINDSKLFIDVLSNY
jgi:hypothetical protein